MSGPPADAISLVAAGARLGINPRTLRHHLDAAGHPCQLGLGRGGQSARRAYLTVSLEEAERIVDERRQAHLGVDDDLPGLSARRVAELLGVSRVTPYHLHSAGYLPADYSVDAPGRRRLRWSLPAVRRYAERQGRALAEAPPSRHTTVNE
ncbi:MAG: helix-turn-helix transcriptional regulator [Candidatus Dormibacteria bacterium]